MIVQPAQNMTADVERRKAAACRAFWSDQPLNVAYRRYRARESFALKDFVAWTVALPVDDFHRLTTGGHR